MCPQTQPASAPRPLRRLAVFAHFDREGRLRPFITHYLEALRPFVSGLWFVSTSGLAEVDQATRNTRALVNAGGLLYRGEALRFPGALITSPHPNLFTHHR